RNDSRPTLRSTLRSTQQPLIRGDLSAIEQRAISTGGSLDVRVLLRGGCPHLMSAEDEAELEVVESLGASKGRAVDVSTLARRSSLNLIGAALFGLFSFASLVIVARGFGPERSGTFLEAVAFFTIATSLVVFGFDESL